jgi:DNA-binding MarR family transcriptional regulator
MVDDLVRKRGYLSLGSRMKRIGERLQLEVQHLLDERSISVQSSQFPLLTSLDQDGPLAIGDIATALGISQPGVTRSVGQLVKQGLVTLHPGETDQRIKMAALTKLGRDIVEEGRQHIWPQIEFCLADILSAQSGTLLNQLDVLEDALEHSSFSTRYSMKPGDQDG